MSFNIFREQDEERNLSLLAISNKINSENNTNDANNVSDQSNPLPSNKDIDSNQLVYIESLLSQLFLELNLSTITHVHISHRKQGSAY